MGLNGFILSGHNNIGVEGWGGVIANGSSLKTSEIGLVGLNCNFFLIFCFLCIYLFALQQKQGD